MNWFSNPKTLITSGVPHLLAITLVVALIGAMLIMKRSSSWSPGCKQRTLGSVQCFDGAILAAVCFPLLFLVATRPDSDSWSFDGGWAFGIATIALAGYAILVSKTTTTPSVLLFGILFAFFGDWVREDVRANRRTASEAGRNREIRVAFASPVEVSNATLWLNGKEVGKLPLELNAAELVRTLPSMADFEKDNQSRYESLSRDHGRGYMFGIRKDSANFCSWSRISIRYGTRNESQRFDAYCQIQSNSVAAWIDSPIFDDSPASDDSNFGFHDVRFRQWENNLTQLAHYARLHDYDVGEDWFKAVCSYEARGWAFFASLASVEPELDDVCDQIVSRLYLVQTLSSHEEAIAALERIKALPDVRSQARSMLRARAIELIAVHLDPVKLKTYLKLNIEDATQLNRHRDVRLNSVSVTPNEPLAYVVWYLDKTWDGLASHSDPNIMEELITPEAIKRSNQAGAFRIGGPAAERLMARQFREVEHDWKMDPEDPGKKLRYRSSLTRLATSSSRMGDWVRDAREAELLSWLEEALQNLDRSDQRSQYSLPDQLEPLFFSNGVGNSRGSLVRKSWRMVLAATEKLPDTNSRWQVRSKWLWWMYPHSTPEMFADTWMKTSLLNQHPSLYQFSFWSSYRKKRLPTKFQFEVLSRILSQRDAELKTLTIPENERAQREAEIAAVIDEMALLPCRGGAVAFVQQQEKLTLPRHVDMLRECMSVNLYHDDHVEVLAEHANVEFRSAALLAVEYHPSPRRRRVLDVLLKDSCGRIQQEALDLQLRLERICMSSLPYKTPPTPVHNEEQNAVQN